MTPSDNRTLDYGASAYEYLPNSNRIKAPHAGWLTGTVLSSFTYDDEGRMTSQTGGISGTTIGGYPTSIHWDQKNRLTSGSSSLSTTTRQSGDLSPGPAADRRYYDPFPGRFLSEDPVGFAAGVNF